MTFFRALATVSILSAFGCLAQAQHLRWRPADDQGSYRCIYGEIKVLASAPTTYFCGCNWWPSCPAGGYTGIQELNGGRHAMIFSIWDTTSDMHTVAVDRGDPRVEMSRFTGEGSGGHTMFDYSWRVGQTYRYFVFKRQDPDRHCTLASTFYFDDYQGRWVYEATIASPDNGDKCIKGFGGDMNAFLENFGGKAKEAPRLALYRLWVGTSPGDLSKVTSATGNGIWGTVNDSFFLGSGDEATLRSYVNGQRSGDADPAWGKDDRLSVPDAKLPDDLVKSLKALVG